MTRPVTCFGAFTRLSLTVLLTTGAAASAAWAQGIAKESIPGGVEARPSITPQLPAGGSPGRSNPALESVQPAPKPAPA